jgi:hypothetical protein
MLRLELPQLTLEAVVSLVADLGPVEDVVQPLVAADLVAKLVNARRRPRAGRSLLVRSGLNGRGPG